MNVEKRIFEKIIEIFKTILFFDDKMVFYCKANACNGSRDFFSDLSVFFQIPWCPYACRRKNVQFTVGNKY